MEGDGVYVIGRNGDRYLDGCGGAAVSCLGHNHPAVIDAIRRQVGTLPYAHTSFFTTTALEELGETLVGRAPGMGRTCILVAGIQVLCLTLLTILSQWPSNLPAPPVDPLLIAVGLMMAAGTAFICAAGAVG